MNARQGDVSVKLMNVSGRE